jgi:hypothetical protein
MGDRNCFFFVLIRRAMFVLFFAQFFVVPTSIDYSSSLQTNYWQLSHLGCVCCDVTQSFVKEKKKKKACKSQ